MHRSAATSPLRPTRKTNPVTTMASREVALVRVFSYYVLVVLWSRVQPRPVSCVSCPSRVAVVVAINKPPSNGSAIYYCSSCFSGSSRQTVFARPSTSNVPLLSQSNTNTRCLCDYLSPLQEILCFYCMLEQKNSVATLILFASCFCPPFAERVLLCSSIFASFLC